MKKKVKSSPRATDKSAKAKNPQVKKEQEVAQQKDFPPKVQKQFAKKSGHPYADK